MTAHVQLITNPDAGSYRAAKIEALRHAFSRHGAKVTLTHCGPGRDAQIAEDADFENVILPLRDGIHLVRKI